MSNRWYIVHAYSNFEKKVAESIREQLTDFGETVSVIGTITKGSGQVVRV